MTARPGAPRRAVTPGTARRLPAGAEGSDGVPLRRAVRCPTARGRRRSCSASAPCCWCHAGAAVASAYGGAPVRLLLLALAAHGGRVLVPRRASRAAQLRGDARRVPRPGSASPAATWAARCSQGDPVTAGRPRRRLPRPAPGRADDRRLAAGLLGGRPARGAAGTGLGAATSCGPRRACASPSSGWASPCSDGGWWRGSRCSPRRRGGSPGWSGAPSSAWAETGAEQWLAAGLMVAAAFGLLVARLREALEPLLGPPRPCRWSPGARRGRGDDRGDLLAGRAGDDADRLCRRAARQRSRRPI